jgi:uncharacterized protein YecT (DUF1311 family)
MLQNQGPPLIVDGTAPSQPQQGGVATSRRAKNAPLTLTIPLSFGGIGKYLVLFIFIAVYEVVAPADAKLSAILGRFEGNTENASLRATVDALQLKVKMEQDERAKAENRINEYRAEVDAKFRTEMETKLAQVRNQLDLQLQSEIEKIKASYDFCNKVKLAGLTAIVAPLQEQLKTALSLDVIGLGEIMRGFYGDTRNIKTDALNKIKAATEEVLATPCQIQVTFTGAQGGTPPQPEARAAPLPVAPQSAPPSALCRKQASFDCAKAKAQDEILICRYDNARNADCRLGFAYADAVRKARTAGEKTSLAKDERSWVTMRNHSCGLELSEATAACFIRQYNARISTLASQYGLSGFYASQP